MLEWTDNIFDILKILKDSCLSFFQYLKGKNKPTKILLQQIFHQFFIVYFCLGFLFSLELRKHLLIFCRDLTLLYDGVDRR